MTNSVSIINHRNMLANYAHDMGICHYMYKIARATLSKANKGQIMQGYSGQPISKGVLMNQCKLAKADLAKSVYLLHNLMYLSGATKVKPVRPKCLK